jgi:hypothetical protein
MTKARQVFMLIGVLFLVNLLSSCNWSFWKATNVTEVEWPQTAPVQLPDGTLFNRTAWVDVTNSTIYYDHECAGDGNCFQNFADQEWWSTHEAAHVAYWKLDHPWGVDLPNQERAAQCIAEVVLRRSVTASPIDQYWDCPASDVLFFRSLMQSAGMLDEHGR